MLAYFEIRQKKVASARQILVRIGYDDKSVIKHHLGIELHACMFHFK